MKCINEQRPKAFIGAAISVGTNIISGIIGNRKKKKAEQAERLRDHERRSAKPQDRDGFGQERLS